MISTAVDHVPANKGKKLPPEPLSPDEVKGLIRACSKRAATGIRNRALIVVLYRAGLRVSESLALLPKDLDQANSTIRVLHGKGDHDRVVGLDAGAWAILQLWLDRRAAAGINGRSPVFCTLKGKAVKPAYVRALLPRLRARLASTSVFTPTVYATPTPLSLPAKGRRFTSFKPNWAMPALLRPTATSGT